MKIDASVVITTFNDGEYLDMLLSDIKSQDLEGFIIEVILLDAGGYSCERALKCLGDKSVLLKYIRSPGMSRPLALNCLFAESNGLIIIRLDARSHVGSDYVKKILNLSKNTGASNVGGVMRPIGKSSGQMLVSDIMRNPFAFGGGKSRSVAYKGYVDSVYLGAYNKGICCYGEEWFDSRNSKISEDSDLNYRIRRNGGSVYLDPSIIVEHYPRESLRAFYRLCYNYGVGRGLFVMKHRVVSAWRQVVPPALLIVFILFVFSVPWDLFGSTLKAMPIFVYFIILFLSTKSEILLRRRLAIVCGIFGCHFFWLLGLIVAPYFYVSYQISDSGLRK